jgi:hypothetical protein
MTRLGPAATGRACAARRGTTLTEAIVAAVVIVAGLATLTPLAVSQSRLALDARHERMALDALSNELARLTALNIAEVPAALQSLAAPDWLQAVLPEARLHGELIDDAEGPRIALHASWPTGATSALRMRTLTGWLIGPPSPATDATESAASAQGATPTSSAAQAAEAEPSDEEEEEEAP